MTGWLLDTLLYTGLLIGLVLLVRRPAARLLGPQFAYMLWALPFLRLLLPPIVLPASLAPEAGPVQAAAAAPVAVPVEVAAAAPQSEAVAIAAPVVTAPPAAAAPAWSWSDIAGAALSVWLGVALAFLAWRVVTYRRMRRELLAEARPVGEVGRIRLVETPAIAAPVAFGVLDKVIALPPLFMAQPDRLARDLAIEHELAHHRGHDLLANFAAQALLALHWFNPLASQGWRAMRRDQEAACDARVLAGRSREERARYAAVIVRAAAGPRMLTLNGALAAPMAGPLFGEKSIIYRLRSLSMSDITRRRRWLGHGLIAGGALALPLTASISYSATAQVPEPPSPPAELPGPPAAPAAPLPPAAPEAGERQVQTFVLRREGGAESERPATVRRFSLQRDGDLPAVAPVPPVPPAPPMPSFEFHGWANPEDPEFEARMEEFGRQMEEWGKKFGEEYARHWEQWGEQQREQALALADRQRGQAMAQAERQREQALAQADRQREQALALAARQRTAARSSLRQARDSIARNRVISEDVRTEILEDLDREIERIEREND